MSRTGALLAVAVAAPLGVVLAVAAIVAAAFVDRRVIATRRLRMVDWRPSI